MRIVTFKHPSLTKRSESVKLEDNYMDIVRDMRETLDEYDGAGISAPQVGHLKRIILVRDTPDDLLLINPEIVSQSGKYVSSKEGCLSIPGVYGTVVRHNRIEVQGLDEHWNLRTIKASGVLSIVLQHEIDHLDGILFIHRATNITFER